MTDAALEKLLAWIKQLTKNRFYGKLVLSYENGRLVHVKKEESIKLD